MTMSPENARAGRNDAHRDIDRLLDELEQARVAMEDMDQRVIQLISVNDELRRQLAEESQRRVQAERQFRTLTETTEARRTDETRDSLLRQQLSTALEELHVMAEELALARDALFAASLANHEDVSSDV